MTAVAACLTSLCAAEESTFAPLTFNVGNTENRTGMWMCADLGKAEDILPLKTRLWATKESVTGGVALKCLFEPGSKASLNWELAKLPEGSAGITLYAKASGPLKLGIGKLDPSKRAKIDVGTEWKKFDLTWEALGTTKAERNIDWLLTIAAVDPIKERTWLIIDRIGTESPEFIANPKIDPKAGPDETISTKDFLYGAESLAKTLQRAKDKKPFKIYAFGDSITLGAQRQRGTWAVGDKAGDPFLWHHHIARLWEEKFGYTDTHITVAFDGVPGTITDTHLKNFEPFIKNATADDVIIIAANAAPAEWKAPLLKFIAMAKKKTDQIIVLSPTPGDLVVNSSADVTKVLATDPSARLDASIRCGREARTTGANRKWATS